MDDTLQASILIVDDDRASIVAMQQILASIGARLVTASSGEEARAGSASRKSKTVSAWTQRVF